MRRRLEISTFALFLACAILTGCSSTNGGGIPATPSTTKRQGTIVVYGATPSGITAAIQAARQGKTVTLLEPSVQIGGIVTSGLGYADITTSYIPAIGGLAKEFYQTIQSTYGAVDSRNGYSYEPHVALQVFKLMLGAQSNITLIANAPLQSVSMSGTTIQSLVAGGNTYVGDEFIDASYTGDLMAAIGVSYTVGRESRSTYGETLNGVRDPQQMGGLSIDPYVVPGDPSSGLLPHVSADTLAPAGSADKSVMAYNYRLCMVRDTTDKIPLSEPAGYNAAEFEADARYADAAAAAGRQLALSEFLLVNALPNNKFDVNSGGLLLSTDDVGESAGYPNGTSSQRAAIEAEHRRYIQSVLWWLATSSRLPPKFNQLMKGYGYCKDEFTATNGFPPQIYVREARHMVGSYVMTQNNIVSGSAPNSIGRGGYPFDGHIANRLARNGLIMNEGMTETSMVDSIAPNPYPISYGALTPQATQATNLLVPVCMSATHAAYFSIRVEATSMILGQAAGEAASLAIDEQLPVQSVSSSALTKQLLADGAIL